jgi:hypothetical protein
VRAEEASAALKKDLARIGEAFERHRAEALTAVGVVVERLSALYFGAFTRLTQGRAAAKISVKEAKRVIAAEVCSLFLI